MCVRVIASSVMVLLSAWGAVMPHLFHTFRHLRKIKIRGRKERKKKGSALVVPLPEV